MLKIRLTRRGRKKLPHYRVVVAQATKKRDGDFVECLGFYTPSLPSDKEERVVLNVERALYWIGKGAQPTERVAIFLAQKGALPSKQRQNLTKGKPKAKAQKRLAEQAALQQANNDAATGEEAAAAG